MTKEAEEQEVRAFAKRIFGGGLALSKVLTREEAIVLYGINLYKEKGEKSNDKPRKDKSNKKRNGK